MIVTEKEAAEKWCPHVRVLIGPDNARWQGMSFNTRLDELKNQLSMCCIGSRCMAWRWRHEPVVGMYYRGERIDPAPTKPERGYCGLAGKVTP